MISLNEILFLLFAFVTVFLSIKLSYYADSLNKTSKVSGLFIGGIVLAGVTSLPELVTCFSAIAVSNNELAVGDILGSNIFNIFMICFFDLVFLKKTMFLRTNKSHSLIFKLLLVNYFVLYFFIKKICNIFILSVGLPTIIVLLSYWYYIYIISKNENKVVINDSSSSGVGIKLALTAILMIFSSVVLTVLVDNISRTHSTFSSSFLGAIFLGVTTSLPEVVTCYALLSMDSYDLALSDIIGSNFFNLLVLAIGDLFVRSGSIYTFSDGDEVMLVILGFIFTLVLTIINKFKKGIFKNCYGLFSLLIVVSYIGYWIINFLR